jgi:hypothetical protein
MKVGTQVREALRDECIAEWGAASGVDVEGLDVGQRWVIFAALSFLAYVGAVPALRRLVAYLLSHCDLGLTSLVIGAAVGTTDRAVRKGRELPPEEFWQRMQNARRGHKPAKLDREQVGPVAKYLAEHKRCSVAELLSYIDKTFGVRMDRLTLRRFLKRYGLGCLREEAVDDTPLLPAALHSGVHSH